MWPSAERSGARPGSLDDLRGTPLPIADAVVDAIFQLLVLRAELLYLSQPSTARCPFKKSLCGRPGGVESDPDATRS